MVGLFVFAAAQAFSFGGLTATAPVNFNTQGLTACVGTVVKGWCTLEQPSFGEVKIEHSVVSIRDGYIDGLTIRGAGYDFDDAIAALKAKFGPPSQIDRLPSQRQSGGTWWHYNWWLSDGVLAISRDADEPSFLIVFVSNRPRIPPKVDF